MRHKEAVALAQAPEDEPAAIFFAFSRDLGVLGEELVMLPISMTTNRALILGLELRASRFARIDLARSIAGRVASCDDVRAWFAERLTPRR